jgi:cation:H+ antiporter
LGHIAGNYLKKIVGLGLGAHIFVLGAKGIALALGVSSLIIGMSIVALGTSLPEMATSITAAKQNQSGIVIGNIIGSNIMNIVAVLGFTLIIRPIHIEFSDIISQGSFLIILTTGLLMLFKFRGGINKLPARILVFIYLLFIYYNFQAGVGIAL